MTKKTTEAVHNRSSPASVGVGAGGSAGVLITFRSPADDRANFDPQTNDYVKTGWQDSFLRLTGYRRNSISFEFVRRLAWALGKREGAFRGCVLHRAVADGERPGYGRDSLAETIPPDDLIEPAWMVLEGATVFFPRSIDDMEPIVNVECHDAVVYLGLSKSAGFIMRLDEDDEWLVSCDSAVAVPAIEEICKSLSLPIETDEFLPDVAAGYSEFVPELRLRTDD